MNKGQIHFIQVCFLCLLSACSADKVHDFQGFLKDYHDARYQQYPTLATLSGKHDYDYLIEIPDEANRQQERQFCQSYLQRLSQFKLPALKQSDQEKVRVIQEQLQQTLVELDSIQTYKKDASIYEVTTAFQAILNADYTSREDRLRVISRRLQFVPDYYAAAKANLEPEATQFKRAILLNRAAFQWFSQDLRAAVQASALPREEKQQLDRHIEVSRLAVKDYVAFCNSRIFDQMD